LIIDPGDDAEYIINRIRDLEVTPIGIIATHGHFDHIVAVNELKLAYKIPFYLHQKELETLKRFRKMTNYFAGFDPGPAPIPEKIIKGKEILRVGKGRLRVIETPGHTPGSISLYIKGLVFVGDLLFSGGAVGRTDLPGGDKNKLDISIKKILKLPETTVIYPGHGKETVVKKEISYLSD
jgi:glyoxylase-like metal-dependent hydrolase (beta-lactamase superfamily II)